MQLKRANLHQMKIITTIKIITFPTTTTATIKKIKNPEIISNHRQMRKQQHQRWTPTIQIQRDQVNLVRKIPRHQRQQQHHQHLMKVKKDH